MKASIPLSFGSVLIAVAISPLKIPWAAFLEWIGGFLVFAALSYSLELRMSLSLNVFTFVAGSALDTLICGFNPMGWVLTNYMLFVHSSLGALLGLLLRRHAYAKEM